MLWATTAPTRIARLFLRFPFCVLSEANIVFISPNLGADAVSTEIHGGAAAVNAELSEVLAGSSRRLVVR
jgi:hypothetical protein